MAGEQPPQLTPEEQAEKDREEAGWKRFEERLGKHKEEVVAAVSEVVAPLVNPKGEGGKEGNNGGGTQRGSDGGGSGGGKGNDGGSNDRGNSGDPPLVPRRRRRLLEFL